jgi:hypothetical protein
MRDDTIDCADLGVWRVASASDVALLVWGLRRRALWAQARALLVQLCGARIAQVTIAATRGEEDFNEDFHDERYGYGGLQERTAGADWRAYEDQPFRVTDAAGNLLDVDLTLPYWRVEAQRADTIAAQVGAGPWRRPLAPDLALEAARSAARDWTTVDGRDDRWFMWREFICDVLRAARVTLAAEALAFDFTAPPPTLDGAIAARVDLFEALAAAQVKER